MTTTIFSLRRRWGILSFLLLAAVTLLPTSVMAGGNVYLAPTSSTVAAGGRFTVTVHENSGSDSVNAVEIHLSYPTDKVTFVSFAQGSSFPVNAQSSGGGGAVVLSFGDYGAGVTGDKIVATVTFQVNSGVTGPIAINVTSAQVIRSSDQANVNGAASGATYNAIIPTPVPTKAPTPTPTPPPSTPPTITGVKVSGIGTNTATVSWTTDRPASSVVNYGANDKYGIADQSTDLVTAHTVTLTSALLTPGVTYHYQVKSIDQWGNAATSPDATFTLAGYKVTLFLTDKDGNPLVNTGVTLIGPGGNAKGTTDADGKVTFANATPGTQSLVVDAPGAKAATVTVNDKPTQSYNVEVAGASANNGTQMFLTTWLPAILAALCIIIPLLAFAGVRLWQWSKNRSNPPSTPPTTEPAAFEPQASAPAETGPVDYPSSPADPVAPSTFMAQPPADPMTPDHEAVPDHDLTPSHTPYEPPVFGQPDSSPSDQTQNQVNSDGITYKTE